MDDPENKPRRRVYETVLKRLDERWKRRPLDRPRMMQEIVNALWESFGGGVYAWCGFYYPVKNGAELVLGPCRDKPACSPIGAHGVCGKAMTTRESQIVPDVKELGSAYVECDPSHKSEIVIPATDESGVVFAVLDVDSTMPAAFNDEDRRWLERIVRVLRHTPAPTSESL